MKIYQHCIVPILLAVLLTSVQVQGNDHCTPEDVQGTWILDIDESYPDCKEYFYPTVRHHVELYQPDLVIDEFGNEGKWTLVYGSGFDITIAHRKYLIVFDSDQETYQQKCYQGKNGTTRDSMNRQWSCFRAYKKTWELTSNTNTTVRANYRKPAPKVPYRANYDFVRQINAVQNSWTAVHYDKYEKFTLFDIQRRKGGFRSTTYRRSSTQRVRQETPLNTLKSFNKLPESFDWRHPPNGGPSPVTPVRDQAHCGSCYAFASAGMLEARVRLATNFTKQPILSTQDVIECNADTNGCDGGLNYLVAGKYAEEVGMALEDCNTYKGIDIPRCRTRDNCERYYATDYKYLGGYYGACNEYLMQQELVENGPFAVALEVYNDFINYKSGIYHHTNLTDQLNKFDPLEYVNHAVLLVGYGVDSETKQPYWIVKNSWGADWGENGFFRIVRGNDECSIESMAVVSTPIV